MKWPACTGHFIRSTCSGQLFELLFRGLGLGCTRVLLHYSLEENPCCGIVAHGLECGSLLEQCMRNPVAPRVSIHDLLVCFDGIRILLFRIIAFPDRKQSVIGKFRFRVFRQELLKFLSCIIELALLERLHGLVVLDLFGIFLFHGGGEEEEAKTGRLWRLEELELKLEAMPVEGPIRRKAERAREDVGPGPVLPG